MRRRNTFAALGGLLCITLALGGCAGVANLPTPTPRVITQVVDVPTPTPCRPALDPAPAYPDTDTALKAAPDLFARVRLLVAGRLLRMARETQLDAAVAACAGG